jgi:hypothetical protein
MLATMKTIATTALLAAMASTANTAPVNFSHVADRLNRDLVQVHGYHRSCERGPGGWHRHNRYGERRHCREWRGEGRRPDYCVRVGPLWYCDY